MLTSTVDFTLIPIPVWKGKKNPVVWPSFLPQSFFIVFLLQPYSEFILSIFSFLSRSWPLRLLLQAVESLQQRLYGLININERSIRTCLCAEAFFSFCLCMHVNLNGCGNAYTSQPLCLRLMGFIFLKLCVSKFLISWTTLRLWIKEIRRVSCKQHRSIELLWWHYRNWYLLNTFDAIYQHINGITLIPCTNELICIIKLLCLFCLHFLLICIPARGFSLCHICLTCYEILTSSINSHWAEFLSNPIHHYSVSLALPQCDIHETLPWYPALEAFTLNRA